MGRGRAGSEVDAATEAAPRDEAAAARVLVVTFDGETRTHALPAEGRVSVGRDASCDVRIDRPWISRRHLELHCSPAAVTVEDLGGRTGTNLAGQRLAPGRRAALRPGEPLSVGTASLSYVGPPKPLATPPVAPTGAPLGKAMRDLYALLDRIAPSRLNVLVVGETGVGKERVATAVHTRSPRAQGPFVSVNCASFTEALLESELFGHERGAFTGAVAAKVGLIESAEGGTVFLDEIGEIPMALQAKLLRVLEERDVRRVGAVRSKRVDVRFVAATNRDLQADCAAGKFREDLFFRLRGVILRIPPLRERTDEILTLARLFVRETSEGRRSLSPASERCLLDYGWPGNVREMRQVLDRAALVAPGEHVEPEHLDLAEALPGPAVAAPRRAGTYFRATGPLAETERAQILEALAASDGNRTRAAKVLGISRRTLTTRLQRYGLRRD